MFFIPSSGATRHLPPKGKVLELPDKLKFDHPKGKINYGNFRNRTLA